MCKNIRELCYVWSKMTFGECFEIISEKEENENVINEARDLIRELGGYKTAMTGKFVEGLKYDPTVEIDNSTIIFSGIYRGITQRAYFMPVIYLMEVIRELLIKEVPREKYHAWIGRSMRTFASFLREEDLEFNLQPKIKRLDTNATTITGADMDVKEHTDILVKIWREEYNIWSYQSTDRGLDNIKEKLLDNRDGKIRDGVNILVPVNTWYKRKENENYKPDEILGWYFTPDDEVEKVSEIIYDIHNGNVEPWEYSNNEDGVKDYLMKYKEGKELKKLKDKVNVFIKNENASQKVNDNPFDTSDSHQIKYGGVYMDKLEAKWAVFFNECGFSWTYCPNGFELGESQQLSGFRLKDIRFRYDIGRDGYSAECFVIVKSEIDEASRNLMFQARKNDSIPFYVVGDIPYSNSWTDDIDYVFGISDIEDGVYYSYATLDGDGYPAALFVDKEGYPAFAGPDHDLDNMDTVKTLYALKKAREANF